MVPNLSPSSQMVSTRSLHGGRGEGIVLPQAGPAGRLKGAWPSPNTVLQGWWGKGMALAPNQSHGREVAWLGLDPGVGEGVWTGLAGEGSMHRAWEFCRGRVAIFSCWQISEPLGDPHRPDEMSLCCSWTVAQRLSTPVSGY